MAVVIEPVDPKWLKLSYIGGLKSLKFKQHYYINPSNLDLIIRIEYLNETYTDHNQYFSKGGKYYKKNLQECGEALNKATEVVGNLIVDYREGRIIYRNPNTEILFGE